MSNYPTLQQEISAVIDNLKGRKWIQGEEQRPDGAVCAHGAVMTCQGLRPGDAHIIIRRAAVLTEDEARSLAAARAAALAAARDAARAAALAAALAAARAAALAAALAAARAAALAAALAASVADLVGQHGLTQEHIDTLMAPWVQVLGTDWADGVAK